MKQNNIANAELPIADIHLPDAIGFWPPAIGWWLAFIVVIVALYIFIRWAYRSVRAYQKKWGYRKAALTLLDDEFQAIQTQPKQSPIPLLRLLKRTAINAYPDQNIQGLYGQAWIDCLNHQTEENYFDEQFTTIFYQQQYQNNSDLTDHQTDFHFDTATQNKKLYQSIKLWIKNHRVEFTAIDLKKQEVNHV